ncbi:AglZ/HisF2 family acetamidino modification protein [Chitinophaga sp. NPDC101104]|uniref:AglZ/HisF2 family acetamidino modification protein n=1 Tax=Chitinophaga sp. NPDC101104 TaxID=3390561 RepID=UPI003CFBE585
MKSVRVIPTLLLKDGGLVKTKKFNSPVYIGDPTNAVRIFNEKEVDELILIDIEATSQKNEPDYQLIERIVSESFMPVCYGGGIKTVDQARQLFRLGVDKIALNSAAAENPSLIGKLAAQFGSQAVVVSIDYKKNLWGKVKVFTQNGTKNTGLDPINYARELDSLGVGEIYLTSIDREGTMSGYDIEMLKAVSQSVSIPVIANGGAGTLEHFGEAIQAGASAVSAGSMFVFHGRLKGILINYPEKKALNKIFGI